MAAVVWLSTKPVRWSHVLRVAVAASVVAAAAVTAAVAVVAAAAATAVAAAVVVAAAVAVVTAVAVAATDLPMASPGDAVQDKGALGPLLLWVVTRFAVP